MRSLFLPLFFLASLSWSQYSNSVYLSCSNSGSVSNETSFSAAGRCYQNNNSFVITCTATGSPDDTKTVNLQNQIISNVSIERSFSCSGIRCLVSNGSCYSLAINNNFQNSTGCQALTDFSFGRANANGSVNGSCVFTYQTTAMPSCSDLLPVPAENCAGGQGLFFRSPAMNAIDIIGGMFGIPANEGQGFGGNYYTWDNAPQTLIERPTSSPDNFRPDGSECSNFNSGSGSLFDYTICPQGFADEPSSSSSEENPSSDSGGGDCDGYEFECQSSGSGGGNGSSGSGSGDCENLSGCDWAKLSYQLEQLGVEQEIRDELQDIYNRLGQGQSNDDYNTGRVLAGLGALDSSIRAGAMSIGDGIRGLADLLGGGGNGDGNGNGNGEGEGSGDGSTSSGGSCTGDDCLGAAGGVGDTTGMGGKADALIRGGGRVSIYTDQQIGALIPVPSGGQCPVISGNVGLAGSSRQVSFDFNNLVPGSPFNVASFIKTVLLLFVYFANVFTMLKIFQSGGRG